MERQLQISYYLAMVLLAMAIAQTGRLFFPSFEYIGEKAENSLPDGFGTCIWSNGLLGDLFGSQSPKNAQKDGIYTGEWKNGKREGQGTYTTHGNIYEGTWVDDDLRLGKVVITNPAPFINLSRIFAKASSTSPLLYEGFFFDLLPDGKGKLTCADYTYEGQFVLGKRSGFGSENGEPLALYDNDEKQDINVITDKRIYGIDISHYQPIVSWDKLYVPVDSSYTYNDTISRQIGIIPVSFVFLKATEGKQYFDYTYEKHCDWAERFGIPHGAYHFYNHRMATVKEQIDNFTFHVKLNKGDLLPVLDIELFGVSTDSLLVWTDAVEKHYGVKPIVYANEKIAKLYVDNTRLKENILWHARYGNKVERTFSIHQYSETGRTPGILYHPIDLDTLSQGITVEDLLFK
ncbi:MAG: hypothetical protein MJZ41_16355 [Bacteroidaceae bacterium]|nr:hypothetical protein [Bacteroidaceae bacterium]